MRPGQRTKRHRRLYLLAAVPAFAIAIVGIVPVTWGQGFFGSWGNDSWGNESRRERGWSNDDRSRSRGDGWDRWNDRDSEHPREQPRQAPRRAPTTAQHSSGAYCVRTCDGFYFPLSSKQGDAQALCQSLCPAAKTDVYYRRGETMEQAWNRSGKSYAALPAAFAYRKELKPGCSCRSADTPAMSVASDPTLRSGDLVVTKSGVTVFRGGSPPHQDRDFVDYRNARGVAGQHRNQLDAMINRYYDTRAQAPDAGQKAKQQDEPRRSRRDRRRR